MIGLMGSAAMTGALKRVTVTGYYLSASVTVIKQTVTAIWSLRQCAPASRRRSRQPPYQHHAQTNYLLHHFGVAWALLRK